MSRHQIALAAALGLGFTTLASADVTLVSSDGRWVATIEDTGGGAGQATSLKDTTQSVPHQNSLSQTIHFVRYGSTIFFNDTLTVRMEDMFTLLSFSTTYDSFTAVMVASGGPGQIAMIHGEMVSGNAGGLRVSMSFVDTSPPINPLLGSTIQPFVYVNLNVDGQMLSNAGNWDGANHFWQKSNASGTGNIRWFRGLNPDKHESWHDSLLQDKLDGGTKELANLAWTGPGDINTAMSWAADGLGDGEIYTVAYAIGNQNITIPADFGLFPAASKVTIMSDDFRWQADVATTNGNYGPGSAGDLDEIRDLGSSMPSFLFHTFNHLSVDTEPGAVFAKMRDTFSPIGFYFAPESARGYTAVLASDLYPGLIAIVEGTMLEGETGGAAMCIKFIDTVGQGLVVKPVVVADMDVDNTTNNTGGFATDHFFQSASPNLTGNVRWVRPASFDAYYGDWINNVYSTLSSTNTLPNTAIAGPTDIGTAIGFHEWTLVKNEAYVIGLAIGNPNVTVPPDFCTPTVPNLCSGDFNGDFVIDGADLGMLLASWGTSAGDLDGNGNTDGSDLGLLLAAWGSCL